MDSYYKGHSPLPERFLHAVRGLSHVWHKEPNFKIGDYVTGGFPHDIQAHLVNEEKNEK